MLSEHQGRAGDSMLKSAALWIGIASLVCLLVGCRNEQPNFTPGAQARREARTKLRTGMTPSEVAGVAGEPQEYRPARAAGHDDVGIYKVGDGTLTVYYFNGRLTRVRASNEPVNR